MARMKQNREVREEQIHYYERVQGTTYHVECQHTPSGFIGKATIQGSLVRARLEARENLQDILEARWLP